MENLENKVVGTPAEVEIESKPHIYEGLVLVDDGRFDDGGTSIKYWM